MYAEEEYVQLAALQHYVFCPRQCALIHTECQWAENALTTLGKINHERVDNAPSSTKGNTRTARSVRLVSHALGIRGVADVVEYEQSPAGLLVTPVEYKRGTPKQHMADIVQLCAQALCLEEMHGCSIPRAYLFYHTNRRRFAVELTEEVRQETKTAIKETRHMLTTGELPPAVRHGGCDSCSLLELCVPASGAAPASAFNDRRFRAILSMEE